LLLLLRCFSVQPLISYLPAMPLLLLRHGETLWNQQGILQGQSDSPLSLLGWQQAERCAKALRKHAIEHIYSSTAGRAASFAACIAKQLQCPLSLKADLQERGFGALEGISPQQHIDWWQAYYARFRGDHIAIPGAEPASSVQQRIQTLLTFYQKQHSADETVLFVTHGEWIRILCNMQQGLPAWSDAAALPDNAEWMTMHFSVYNPAS